MKTGKKERKTYRVSHSWFAETLDKRKQAFAGIQKRGATVYRKAVVFIKRKPFTSLIVVLALLFFAMLTNVLLSPKTKEAKKEQVVKKVYVYRVGSSPRMSILAQAEKSGVITIVAQAPGIVSTIPIQEKQQVEKGTNVLQLSSNYQGGNATEVQLSIATAQNALTKETFETQKELIAKKREAAEKTDANADDLGSIADASLADSRSLIALNESILSTIDTNLSELEATNDKGTNDDGILQTKQLKSQFLSANNQLRQALRNTELQAAADKPQARLSDLQKEITLRQLDIQEKTIRVNREISQLQVAAAAINASMFHPTAPFAGTIERIYVRVGQSIVPGTRLVTLAGNNQETIAIARIPGKTARVISQFEESTIYIGNASFHAVPTSVSQEATEEQLYTAIFSIPSVYSSEIADGEYVRIEIPIGLPNTSGIIPFVPIDSVYQTQESAFVYTLSSNDTADAKQVTLGEVIGNDVEVLSGLDTGDQIITNRNVIAGDRVSVIN